MHISITHNPDNGYSLANEDGNCILRTLGGTAHFCLNSRIFSLLTLGHLHTFIHELGHAVAHRILTGGEATINLSTASCYGSTTMTDGPRRISSVGKTWIDLSGPLADVIFSVVLIVGIFALTHYVAMPQGLAIALRVIVSVPAFIWIFGEALYAGFSAYKVDSGDFGNIASRGWSHLLISLAILVTICALGILGVVMLF